MEQKDDYASERELAFSSSTPSLNLSENEDHVYSIGKYRNYSKHISRKIQNLNSSAISSR